jgi:hypothetical protein
MAARHWWGILHHAYLSRRSKQSARTDAKTEAWGKLMSPRMWAVDDSPQCRRDSAGTGGNRKKQYPNPDECRGGRTNIRTMNCNRAFPKHHFCHPVSLFAIWDNSCIRFLWDGNVGKCKIAQDLIFCDPPHLAF